MSKREKISFRKYLKKYQKYQNIYILEENIEYKIKFVASLLDIIRIVVLSLKIELDVYQ